MATRTQSLAIFVAVLLLLRVVFRLRISILGSIALTIVIWLAIDQINRRRAG